MLNHFLPIIDATYFLGYFREDYQYNTTPAATPDYLDKSNGRFCITPEYPNGIYCYFATVDSKWNSAYPYVVGPTFYGIKSASKVTSITEPVTTFIITNSAENLIKENLNINVFPNPGSDLIAIQMGNLVKENIKIELIDLMGRVIKTTDIFPGSTMAYFETSSLHRGKYIVKISGQGKVATRQVLIAD